MHRIPEEGLRAFLTEHIYGTGDDEADGYDDEYSYAAGGVDHAKYIDFVRDWITHGNRRNMYTWREAMQAASSDYHKMLKKFYGHGDGDMYYTMPRTMGGEGMEYGGDGTRYINHVKKWYSRGNRRSKYTWREAMELAREDYHPKGRVSKKRRVSKKKSGSKSSYRKCIESVASHHPRIAKKSALELANYVADYYFNPNTGKCRKTKRRVAGVRKRRSVPKKKRSLKMM